MIFAVATPYLFGGRTSNNHTVGTYECTLCFNVDLSAEDIPVHCFNSHPMLHGPWRYMLLFYLKISSFAIVVAAIPVVASLTEIVNMPGSCAASSNYIGAYY